MTCSCVCHSKKDTLETKFLSIWKTQTWTIFMTAGEYELSCKRVMYIGTYQIYNKLIKLLQNTTINNSCYRNQLLCLPKPKKKENKVFTVDP
jgi:hypothetical protein